MPYGLPDLLPELPPTIYKYRAVNANTLRLLTEGSLYFASARDFNDPFDTALGYDFDASREAQFWWTNRFLKKHRRDLDKKARRREARKLLSDVAAAGPERPLVAQELLREQRYRQHGIFCAAGVRDDLLMWAHYAANHEGVCVGLRHDVLNRAVASEVLRGRRIEAYKVAYQDEVSRPSFFETPRPDGWKEWHGRVVAVKSTHWAYEQEYRLVTWAGAGVTLACGPDLVSEVVLGCRITPENTAVVVDALRTSTSPARVYRASTHDRRFELLFEPAL